MLAVVTILTRFGTLWTHKAPSVVVTVDFHALISVVSQASPHALITDTHQKPSRSRSHGAFDAISVMSQVTGRSDNSVGVETNHEGNWGQSSGNARMDGARRVMSHSPKLPDFPLFCNRI